MILFVFEGAKREPDLFRAIETLFFQDKQNIVCSFGNNIYELYNELQRFEGDGDIVSILKERYQGQKDSPFTDDAKSSDFSEIYLIFDYDFQNKNISLDVMNSQLEEMLDMFDDETDNGRLYINYPMVEAIRYTKILPDKDYWTYVVSRKECTDSSFKSIADSFSDYKSLDFLTLSTRRAATEKEIRSRLDNWKLLIVQNVSKANYICSGENEMPEDKDAVSQNAIFDAQKGYIIRSESVSILSAFPLFLFDYFPKDRLLGNGK